MADVPADRLNVLLILGDNQLRGSYARSLAIIGCLPAQSVRLRVLAKSPLPAHFRVPSDVEVTVSRHLNSAGLGRFLLRRFLKELEQDPPQLIDIQQRRMLPVGIRAARELNVPYLLTIHDYLAERERIGLDTSLPHRIVAVSESVRAEFLDRTRLPEAQVTVIPTGVPIPDESELSPILAEGKIPVVGTAGPLEFNKGIQHFLRAAALVKLRHPQTLFLVAGSGPEEKPLRRLARDLKLSDGLTILPNLPEFATAMKAMDIFVLSSLKQGLGATMLEAMVRGLPVIGTESGGVYSVVTHEKSGLLVPPGNEQRLAETVCRLLENPLLAREYGQAARRRVIESFRVDSMIGETCRIYRDLLMSRDAK